MMAELLTSAAHQTSASMGTRGSQPNWVRVSRFLRGLVLGLIRGNMCAKYPRTGQTQICAGLEKQRGEGVSSWATMTAVLTPPTSADGERKIYELTAEDRMKKI